MSKQNNGKFVRVRGVLSDPLDIVFDRLASGAAVVSDVLGQVRFAINDLYWQEKMNADPTTTRFVSEGQGQTHYTNGAELIRQANRLDAALGGMLSASGELSDMADALRETPIAMPAGHEVRAMGVEVRAGRMISSSNMEKIQAAMEALKAIVDRVTGAGQEAPMDDSSEESDAEDQSPEEEIPEEGQGQPPEGAPEKKGPPKQPPADAQGDPAANNERPLSQEEEQTLQALLRRRRRAGTVAAQEAVGAPGQARTASLGGDLGDELGESMQALKTELAALARGLGEEDPEAAEEKALAVMRSSLGDLIQSVESVTTSKPATPATPPASVIRGEPQKRAQSLFELRAGVNEVLAALGQK